MTLRQMAVAALAERHSNSKFVDMRHCGLRLGDIASTEWLHNAQPSKQQQHGSITHQQVE